MNSIEIYINSIGNNINAYIDTKKYKIRINNKEKDLTEEKLNELLRIIRTWHNLYKKDNNQIEYETFLININTDEGTECIKGNGDYPENYIAFKEWVNEYNE